MYLGEPKQFEQNRNEYINILKELRQKNPDIGIDELQQMAELEILKRGPKSRAFYRVQATRKLIGNPTNLKKKLAEKILNLTRLSKTVVVLCCLFLEVVYLRQAYLEQI